MPAEGKANKKLAGHFCHPICWTTANFLLGQETTLEHDSSTNPHVEEVVVKRRARVVIAPLSHVGRIYSGRPWR
ncbi:hypothetical protein Y032_0086g1892 [Ancylostoma ceylanicum]|uniref:Uncharacterized protein n=1 Tax=Ancylostoma ceylanicum TaxID=53326 RepID=A0A016TPI6_9BILA|nr:hypothetical protein Y032_0086g1892 [Ancylostoma ceylanicum]